jgi:hypothetical protein
LALAHHHVVLPTAPGAAWHPAHPVCASAASWLGRLCASAPRERSGWGRRRLRAARGLRPSTWGGHAAPRSRWLTGIPPTCPPVPPRLSAGRATRPGWRVSPRKHCRRVSGKRHSQVGLQRAGEGLKLSDSLSFQAQVRV